MSAKSRYTHWHWRTHISWYAQRVLTMFTRVPEIEHRKSYLQVVCYLKSDSGRLFSVCGVNVRWLCLALVLVCQPACVNVTYVITMFVQQGHTAGETISLLGCCQLTAVVTRILALVNGATVISWCCIIILQALSRWSYSKKPEIYISFFKILHHWDGANT